ncbi:S49 family peptidase [Radicibacter daui]|uniref:S49 family peptidase n=1 Tax=Radicibacter daui TaxID=3064829 RepID=UPI004046C9EF
MKILSRLGQLIPSRLKRKRAPRVAVLRLYGTIAPGRRGLRGGGDINMAGLEPLLEEAFSVGGLSAVALAINCPGGSPAQSSLIAGRIRELAAEHEVPVLAFCEDVAASGGYWLAAAADEIFVDPASLVGSIGVVSGGFGFNRALEKLGIDRRLYTRGERKAILDPFRPEKPEDVAELDRMMGALHSLFIDHVKVRRAGRIDAEDQKLFSGAVWVGQEAVTLGLADGIGEMRSVLRQRFGKKVKLREMARPRSLLSRFGLAAGSALADGVVDAAERKALWARFGL